MTGNDQEELFLERTSALLSRSVENIDSRTGRRLEHIRMKALGALEEKPLGFFFPLRWITFGSLATVAMAVIALFFWLNTPPKDLPGRYIEDFEIITSREPIDFYQDLEFYRWMATQNGPIHRSI